MIDPNSAVRAVVRRMIEGLGYKAAEAGQLQDGLAVISAHCEALALVILELAPAQVAPVAELSAINLACPGTPVVLTSAGSIIAAGAWPTATNVIGFLAKPYTRRDLARLLSCHAAEPGEETDQG